MYQQQKSDELLNLQQFAYESTLKIIIKFLFPHLSGKDLFDCETSTQNFLKSYSASFLFIPKWVPGTFSGISNFDKEKTQLDDKFYYYFLLGIKSGFDSPLSKLQDAPKSEVLDHIRTFIIAGHETSATSLVWALYYIHNSPYIKNRLSEELNIFSPSTEPEFLDNILKNEFLDAIISETFRIRPPVPFVTRKVANRSFKLGDQVLKENEELGVCVALLHREASLWSNPDEFKPERFLNHKYSPHEYAPFGGGIRKCIGAELASMELKILIGNFLKNYDATLIEGPGPIAEVLQITIGPKKPIFLKCSKRVY
ncbi:MAG: cytochrome P450 [Alphaproteobacteria bacterium]|nr:MAG: cytochrome P450 [Alphaproteobacteria bacterium]